MAAARAHLAYIEREGVERDGSQGRMFGAEGDVRRADFAAPIEEEKRQFRFIIAPEDGEELDLRDYTRRLVGRMEKDLGRKLRWAAVCHYDTDSPHVHLVVRGVDARGQDVRIDRTYLSESLRLRAQELATNELGPRSEIVVRRQLDREVSQPRLTTIDRRLVPLVAPDGTLAMADIAAAANEWKVSRPHAIARVQVLEQLHLVERVSRTSWRFENGWQETLQRLGERGDIIKRMRRALRQAPAAYQIFDPADGRTIEGVVRHKGLHDEHTGTAFVIVETARKEAHYVRLDAAGAEPLVTGTRVRVATVPTKWLTAPDQAIHRVAQEHGGIYSAAAHRRQLEARPVVIEGCRLSPESVVEVNLRRLERLARYNLVTRISEDAWQVPPNLVEILRDRERTHPRHRIEIQRLDRSVGLERPRGPTRG
jgi:type IV secretory pathway VirD2 relaxase